MGKISISSGLSLICVVGDHLSENRGKVRQLFSALQDIPLRMISYGAAKNSIAFLVETSLKAEALEALNLLLTTNLESKKQLCAESQRKRPGTENDPELRAGCGLCQRK